MLRPQYLLGHWVTFPLSRPCLFLTLQRALSCLTPWASLLLSKLIQSLEPHSAWVTVCGLRKCFLGNSLVVQWLGLGAFTAVAQVQSLIGELKSHKPCGMAKKKKKKCFLKSSWRRACPGSLASSSSWVGVVHKPTWAGWGVNQVQGERPPVSGEVPSQGWVCVCVCARVEVLLDYSRLGLLHSLRV